MMLLIPTQLSVHLAHLNNLVLDSGSVGSIEVLQLEKCGFDSNFLLCHMLVW